jgi:2-keto-3-deoxy-L-rhamnonate aldolase RhmA
MATDRAWIERVRAMGYSMIAVGTDPGLFGAAVQELVGCVDAKGGAR